MLMLPFLSFSGLLRVFTSWPSGFLVEICLVGGFGLSALLRLSGRSLIFAGEVGEGTRKGEPVEGLFVTVVFSSTADSASSSTLRKSSGPTGDTGESPSSGSDSTSCSGYLYEVKTGNKY